MSEEQQSHTIYECRREWENHHQTVRFTPERYYDVWNFWDDNSSPTANKWRPGFCALQKIVRDAEAADCQVRAVGGGWSLSNAVETPGFLLNTKPLNIIEIGLRHVNCDPTYKGNPARLVFAQCGAGIAELNRELENAGLSLPTSGASNGQTICGAMSTGTHGAAVEVGSVQDYVVGVHLISEGGAHYWIQREDRPVVNEHFCNVLGAKLVPDNDLFDAVRVAFGSFGIIHAVLLEAEPIYLLERHVVNVHYAHVLPALSDMKKIGHLGLKDSKGNIAGIRPFHFEVLLNPYAFSDGKNGISEKTGEKAAYIRYMYKRPPGYAPLKWLDRGDTTKSNDAMAAIGVFSDVAWPFISLAAKPLLEGQLPPIYSNEGPDTKTTFLTHGGTFDATQIAGHSMSTEIGFDLQDVPRAVEVIVRETLRFPFSGLPALRYVKRSLACMAFTKFAPYTCAIEIPAVKSTRSKEAFERIWDALDNAGIPHTFHWGQSAHWGADPVKSLHAIKQVFGHRYERWAAARKGFLRKNGHYTFSNPMMHAYGLDT
jgi:hypothetical protein